MRGEDSGGTVGKCMLPLFFGFSRLGGLCVWGQVVTRAVGDGDGDGDGIRQKKYREDTC